MSKIFLQSFTHIIQDPEGFHARPAGIFVKEAKKYPCDITVAKKDRKTDGKKMFGLMGLGIKGGEEITVTVSGEQENQAADALKLFLQENL